eukprot:gnl/TRDRNA2_/TRDRNA2_196240_c0_seq1.p1 gnl/TRDRNA2_/TRDRNA2_196240_c0~~gnl/TRDRNA2_/TRDRNA2_196240_c0_seq1.p1  ORF type:complete len:761 (-),score=164.61 gnl/TRDRNA2_/TRDRNA2_196240_c0_seq1:126-2408(-)
MSDYEWEVPVTFLIILLIGRWLQAKKAIVEHVMGFQQAILGCLLPMFLYKGIVSISTTESGITTSARLWCYPFLALLCSVVMMLGFLVLQAATGVFRDRCQRNTVGIMFASLAPELATFAFIESVVENIEPTTITGGHAGLADLGAKLFALLVLHIAAMWLSVRSLRENKEALAALGSSEATPYGQQPQTEVETATSMKLLGVKALGPPLRAYFVEPTNFVSMIAVVLFAAGPVLLEQQSLWGKVVEYLAACSSPAIFAIMGIKFRVGQMKAQHLKLLSLMAFRSGLALLFACFLRYVDLATELSEVVFWIIFGNSPISFWPYTHISMHACEEELGLLRQCAAHARWIVANDHGDVLTPEMKRRLEELSTAIDVGQMDLAKALEALDEIDPSSKLPGRGALDKLQSTFDPPLALMVASVSFSWTVGFCTLVSFVPHGAWESPATLPTAGAVLLLGGSLSLAVLAREERKAAAADNSVSASKRRRGLHEAVLVEESFINEGDFMNRRQLGALSRCCLSSIPDGEQSQLLQHEDFALASPFGLASTSTTPSAVRGSASVPPSMTTGSIAIGLASLGLASFASSETHAAAVATPMRNADWVRNQSRQRAVQRARACAGANESLVGEKSGPQGPQVRTQALQERRLRAMEADAQKQDSTSKADVTLLVATANKGAAEDDLFNTKRPVSASDTKQQVQVKEATEKRSAFCEAEAEDIMVEDTDQQLELQADVEPRSQPTPREAQTRCGENLLCLDCGSRRSIEGT